MIQDTSGSPVTLEEADLGELDRKLQKELNAGAVSLVLLALLAREPGPAYGYGLARRLEELTGGEPIVRPGTLYPALRALEGQGLAGSSVEPSVAGPPRRYYAITDLGRATLARWRPLWERTRTLVDNVLALGAGDEAAAPAAAEEPQ
ncbi:MAG: PadR family transcriptional regulator [Holophagales bacterium]|nr:MAG: PadR family transcriptional regulator [Holophagales bacterium]